MTKKQWLALLALYVTYLFFGASVFYSLEKDEESIQRDNDYKLYEKLVAALKECGLNLSMTQKLEEYCGRPLTENADLDAITPRLWDFYNSVFFVITVVSTVGYGNIHPTTPVTRAIMMFYAIIGIPMNGILLTSLAQFFSNVFIKAHKKYKRYESRCGLTVDVLKYLVPGILFFIFIPATAFYYFEGWTYDESVYYAFVTLTTIGFGDIVAGQKPFKEFDGNVILLYKILLLCWIIIGLGYLIMILGFITRAMRSKRMAQIEHKLVEALTHSKIWHGFSKDVGYLRRLMNELYLEKFKPVFLEDRHFEKHVFHRSKSLPNFAFGIDEEDFFESADIYQRKRANSDYATYKMRLSRVCSEGDLHRIDRSATFASATKIQPDELIRHVVGVMGGNLPSHGQDSHEPRGIDVFSDDEILKSETWDDGKQKSVVSLNYPPSYEEAITSPKRKRVRALSECVAERNGHTVTSVDNLEWTWSGSGLTKIFDIVNERHRMSMTPSNEKSKKRKSFANLSAGSKWLNPRWKRGRESREVVTGSKKSVCSNGEVKTVDVVSDAAAQEEVAGALPEAKAPAYRPDGHYVTYTPGAGAQGIGLIHGGQYLSRPERSLYDLYKSGDHLFSDGNREALEGRSLTEFLHALSSLHSRIGGGREVEREAGDSTSPKIESLVNLFSPPSQKQRSSEKLQEPSNLKRLGRFLLKSYASPKTDTDSAEPAVPQRRPHNIRASDSHLADSYHTYNGNPSVRIDMDGCDPLSGSNFSQFSLEEPPQIGRNAPKANGLMANLRTRRGSTPAIASNLEGIPASSRMGVSSESVFFDCRRGGQQLRQQPLLRWRPGEPCSVKPTLSDVEEIIK